MQSKILERTNHQIQMAFMKQQMKQKQSKIEAMQVKQEQNERDLNEFMGELAHMCQQNSGDLTNKDDITIYLSEKLQSLEQKNKLLQGAVEDKKIENKNLQKKNKELTDKFEQTKAKSDQQTQQISHLRKESEEKTSLFKRESSTTTELKKQIKDLQKEIEAENKRI